MATLASIRKQIAGLEKQAEAIQRSEALAAAAKAKDLIVRFGLSAADVGLAGKVTTASSKKIAKKTRAGSAVPKTKSAGSPKYQDPKTGMTWTGVGKPPAWIAGKKNRDAFLITLVAAVPVAETATVSAASKPATARKAVTSKQAKPAAVAPAERVKRDASKVAAAVAATPEEAPAKVVTSRKATLKKASARKAAAKPAAAVEPTEAIAGRTAEAIVAPT